MVFLCIPLRTLEIYDRKAIFLSVPNSSKGTGSSKKIIIYAAIGMIAVAAVSLWAFSRPPSGEIGNGQESLHNFKEQWCGVGAKPNSNSYVSEFLLQSECEMPVGIASDAGKVWYVSAKQGILGSYDPEKNNFSHYNIPDWPSREQALTRLPQMPWTVKLDAAGTVWFTDQNNAIWRFLPATKSFDIFRVPAKYPSDLEFDAIGNIYFIGIDSQAIYFGDVSKMKNGSSEGFIEIPLPLEAFEGINPSLITSGLLAIDNERNNVWASLLAFSERKGQLF